MASDEKNIAVHERPAPKWNPDDVDASVEAYYEYARSIAQSAIDWYLRNKSSKQRLSHVTRYASIGLSAAGGLLPLIGSAVLATSAGANPSISAVDLLAWHEWGYVLLGFAAFFLALDRFSGSSTGWMRYITASTAIETLLVDFELEWPALKADKSVDTAKRMERLRAFSRAARSEIEKETQEWVREFAANLAKLEESIDEKRKQAREELRALDEVRRQAQPGALILEIHRGQDVDPQVKVLIDNQVVAEGVTNDCGVANVAVGQRVVAVVGTAKNLPRLASTVVEIKGGGVTEASVNL